LGFDLAVILTAIEMIGKTAVAIFTGGLQYASESCDMVIAR
jgi:hypothetical protein